MTGDNANKKLLSVFTKNLKEEFLNKIKTDPKHWIQQVLKHNDVSDWLPKYPLKLHRGLKMKMLLLKIHIFQKSLHRTRCQKYRDYRA